MIAVVHDVHHGACLQHLLEGRVEFAVASSQNITCTPTLTHHHPGCYCRQVAELDENMRLAVVNWQAVARDVLVLFATVLGGQWLLQRPNLSGDGFAFTAIAVWAGVHAALLWMAVDMSLAWRYTARVVGEVYSMQVGWLSWYHRGLRVGALALQLVLIIMSTAPAAGGSSDELANRRTALQPTATTVTSRQIYKDC